jgi:TDG/mug DNA glycosylase family protein
VRSLTAPVLPDILKPKLRLVFCGSAAGAASACVGAYYAGPGNKFWRMLHETGLTPRLLAPAEFDRLPDYGIGLTDMAKLASGSDASLPKGSDDPAGLQERIMRARPAIMAFNGKRSAQVFFHHAFGRRQLDYGPQEAVLGNTRLFVLPSTSGLASRYWDETPWHALAQACRETENAPT